jgi:hypothetical protein
MGADRRFAWQQFSQERMSALAQKRTFTPFTGQSASLFAAFTKIRPALLTGPRTSSRAPLGDPDSVQVS